MGYRWPTMPRTGEAAVMQEVSRFAGGIGELGLVFHLQQAQVDYEAFKIEFEGEIDALGDRIAKNQDENTYLAETKKVISATNGYMPKNSLAKRFASSFVNQRTPQLHDDAKRAMKLRVQSKWDAGLIMEVDNAIDRGHMIDLMVYVNIGLVNGNINESRRAKILSDTAGAVKTANKGRGIQALIQIGRGQDSEDEALDAMLAAGLELGIDKADINFAQQQVEDDFARQEADEKETEDNRVRDVDADLSRRMFADENRTTAQEIHKANLPRAIRESLLTTTRQRDKDIVEGKDIVTSSFTQIKVNSVISRVAKGELTELEGYQRLRHFEDAVNVKERNANIDAVTTAVKAATDETKRRNATILDEREKKLRDAIERSQGVIQLVKDEEREFLRDLANIAVIELNDRFRDLVFTTQEIDDFNDDLMRKYVLSQQAINQAVKERGGKKTINRKDTDFLDKLLRGGR